MFDLKGRSGGRHARRMLMLALASALVAGWGIPCSKAQTVRQQGAAQAGRELESKGQQPTGVRPPRPLFTLEGVPVYIWAPVPPPYLGSAYETFAGQPMRSGDSVLAGNAAGPRQ